MTPTRGAWLKKMPLPILMAIYFKWILSNSIRFMTHTWESIWLKLNIPMLYNVLEMFSPSPSVGVTKLYPPQNLNRGEGFRFQTLNHQSAIKTRPPHKVITNSH